MNKEIEELNSDWKKYIKWCICFPLVLTILTLIILISSLFFIDKLFVYYGRWDVNFILIIAGLILVSIIGLAIAWLCYLFFNLKYSNRMLNILQSDFNISISVNSIYLIVVVIYFIITLLMTIISLFDNHNKISFMLIIPSLMLIIHWGFLYIKIIDYWQTNIVIYNWKGLIND